MVRTVISLDKNDKQWLDRRAKEEHLTMTEIVRQAIHYYRLKGAKASPGRPGFKEILKMTKGTWSKGDAVAWVRKLRAE
jgi:hypothetical protein